MRVCFPSGQLRSNTLPALFSSSMTTTFFIRLIRVTKITRSSRAPVTCVLLLSGFRYQIMISVRKRCCQPRLSSKISTHRNLPATGYSSCAPLYAGQPRSDITGRYSLGIWPFASPSLNDLQMPRSVHCYRGTQLQMNKPSPSCRPCTPYAHIGEACQLSGRRCREMALWRWPRARQGGAHSK